MTANEVREKVEREISGNWDRPNPHGVDLRRSVLTPELKDYEDSSHEGSQLALWLVLEEHPGTDSGYKIVYDDRRDQYGLAITGQHRRDVFIGYYGTFLETLYAM
jgi:hypothetical protein